jgi:hypothetical protein
MTRRHFFQRFLVTLGMALAVLCAGASRASAQGCIVVPDFFEIETEGPPSICQEFAPGSNSHVFFFDSNNSIKITVNVVNPFDVTVELIELTQAQYQSSRKGSNFPNSTCWETGGPGVCVFYRVTSTALPGDFTGDVTYIVGFTTPVVKGNKHDLMLLRAETFDPFNEEITTKVLRNYQVGDDPGVSGAFNGFSDYIVAFEEIRPASK